MNFIDLTVLNLNGNSGDDVIAVTPNTLAITAINVNGGDPTASDTLIVNGARHPPWRPRPVPWLLARRPSCMQASKLSP